MKKIFLGISIIAFFLFSCNSTSNSDSIGTSDSTNLNSSPSATEVTTQTPTISGDPAIIPANTDQSSATPMASTVASGLNPAHGQPGHRCDISVGAPLSTAPSTSTGSQQGAATPLNTQTISTDPNMISVPSTQPPASPAATTTAPGMNPPHGQPGHDCAVAVGAPLKK